MRDIDYTKIIDKTIRSTIRGLFPILLIILISSLIQTYIIQPIIYDLSLTPMWTTIATTYIPTLLYGVLSIFYIFILVNYMKYNPLHNSKIKKQMIKYIVFGVITLLFLNVFMNLMYTVFNIEVGVNVIIQNQGDLGSIYYLYLIPSMLFIVGPAEEIMIRGIVQGEYREKFGSNKSIVITSMIFALLHIFSVSSGILETIPYVISTFVLSIILGYIYEETKNIMIPSITHGLYNALLVFSIYINQIGYV